VSSPASLTLCLGRLAGLMDAGVGMFILASAIPAGVAVESRVVAPATKASKQLARIGVLVALGTCGTHTGHCISGICNLASDLVDSKAHFPPVDFFG
jgi:hypothetical protein